MGRQQHFCEEKPAEQRLLVLNPPRTCRSPPPLHAVPRCLPGHWSLAFPMNGSLRALALFLILLARPIPSRARTRAVGRTGGTKHRFWQRRRIRPLSRVSKLLAMDVSTLSFAWAVQFPVWVQVRCSLSIADIYSSVGLFSSSRLGFLGSTSIHCQASIPSSPSPVRSRRDR